MLEERMWPGRKHFKRFRRRKSKATTLESNDDDESESYLLALPPELRNEIYQFCFTSDNDDVDILNAIPPSPNLLLTSHQIYHEAWAAYEEGCRDFWRLSNWYIDYHSWYLMGQMRSENLAHVRELKLLVPEKQLDALSADGFTLRTKTILHKYLRVPRDQPVARYRTSDGRWVCSAERPGAEGMEKISLIVTATALG
jgi:hypothetical protein